GSASRPRPPEFVRVSLGGRVLAMRRVGALRRPGSVAALLSAVPATSLVHRGPATIEMHTDRAELAHEVDRVIRGGGGAVAVPQRPASSTIKVPLVQQELRDNCEATALSMILAFRGRHVDQLTLQAEVAHAQPLDPTTAPNGSEVWGDPNQGFVGRADGGGPAGGYGVYQGPIEALARRHGVDLRNLTGRSPTAVYGALLSGHPVMAWVALAAGPYASWETPAGRTVHINYGEHAVVLTGLEQGYVLVNDPLSGTHLTWTEAQFEQMWAGLGHRALAA
ncbi:MAG TPA: C39 family peptidase, partial [Solirubrobacterales bacterium]